MGVYSLCFAPDIDDAEQEQWDEVRKSAPPCIMHPEATFRKYWDIGSVFCILYSCYTVPYFMALEAEPTGTIKYVDTAVDILFIVDIILVFMTARIVLTEDGPVTVVDMGQIAVLYFKGWFIPDFLSSFPFDAVIAATTNCGDMNPETARVAKLGRIFRLLKILRMVRTQDLTVCNLFLVALPHSSTSPSARSASKPIAPTQTQ